MKSSLNVTLLMDEAWVPSDDPDFSKDILEAQTERHIAMALRELGHNVRVCGVGFDVAAIVSEIEANPPDMVFNLVEQFGDDRRLDKNVAALLEMLDVRFTGTGCAGMFICRDKGLCKQLLGLHHVPIPRFALFELGKAIRSPKDVPYPMVVKPVCEDASDGIAKASLVHTPEELSDRVRYVHEHWHQTAIAEEFIDGRELYVGVLGNKRLTVFPSRELRFGHNSPDGPRIATSRVKSDDAYRKKWKIEYDHAELSDKEFRHIASVCRQTFHVLQLQDYCRVDLRLMADGRVAVLEANPNPEIAYGDDFAEAADRAGIDYNKLVQRILSLAWARYEA